MEGVTMKPLIIPGPAERKLFPPEAVAEMDREIDEAKRQGLIVQTYLGNSPEFTDDETKYLEASHSCGPLAGPHGDNCNLFEIIYAVAAKRKEQAEGR